MAQPRTDFPPIRACLFDMDGLLLNTEDIYTLCHNILLETYSSGPMDWTIKPQLQGRPAAIAIQRLLKYFDLPHVSPADYTTKLHTIQEIEFQKAIPLPGTISLLQTLTNPSTTNTNGDKIHIALATSSSRPHFKLKTDHLTEMFSLFPPNLQILGDDPRIPAGKGKPAPDIYLLALEAINESLKPGEKGILPEECLVFEDGVPGVVSGRRAGIRVCWVPHMELANVLQGKEGLVLSGREIDEVSKEEIEVVSDGWAEQRVSLEDFPYEKYGVIVRGPEA